MNSVHDTFGAATNAVNRLFQHQQPWQIVSITVTTVLSSVWLYNLVSQDESIVTRFKKRLFKWARYIPAIQKKIDHQIAKTTQDFENGIIDVVGNVPYITKLPVNGMKDDEIMKLVDDYLALGHYNWKGGKVSGTVYYYDQQLIDLITKVYGKASYTNPLHPDVFPGVCKMEAEVIRMTIRLFNGDSSACGVVTTGGTESIIMASKAYRDYAREERGITQPNIVVPTTAHSAFDKAAQYLKLHVRTAKINPDTCQVDIRDMERQINSNTIMLVGSVPNYPYGTFDDIEAIGALGAKYNIPVHVDACLGGFVIIFMEKAGFTLPRYDFRVKGVTSISADTHKYGFAPKGSSLILYSHTKYRNHQYTVTTDWPGGVYGSPAVSGSRAGGIIAATWATLIRFGETGYVDATKKIIETSKYIEAELRKIDEIYLFGQPRTTVVAIGSKVFDIYRLSAKMGALGWNLNTLQFPSGIHICVTYTHTAPGVAEQFVNDVRTCVTECLINREKPVEGKMALYGMAQQLPDRSVVGDFTRCFLDSMYYTPPEN